MAPGGFNFDAKLSVPVFPFDFCFHICEYIFQGGSLVSFYNVYTFLIPQLLDGGKAQMSRICSLLISVEWIPWPVDSVMLPSL